MAVYRGGMLIAGAITDEQVGMQLDALKAHDGAIEVDTPDQAALMFSFDAADLPGVASGLVAAMPRTLSIARSALRAAGVLASGGVEVVGLSVERVGDG